MSLRQAIERRWYTTPGWLKALLPLEALYRGIAACRRRYWLARPQQSHRATVPVIVVGNLSVGGTGKSPLVAWLVAHLRQQGFRPGIAARGYGGKAAQYPLQVTSESDPAEAGDEPVMLAAQTGVKVAVSPRRAEAVALLEEAGCDIIVCDDGLQHYALARDLELVVVDGAREFGNHHCLPVGPLREPLTRLDEVDAVIVNGAAAPALNVPAFRADIAASHFRRLDNDQCLPLSPLPFSGPVVALAGIGHPQRFFALLKSLGVTGREVAYADHHRFSAPDVTFPGCQAVVMTAKDAVKCRIWADGQPRYWSLDIALTPEDRFIDWLDQRLQGLCDQFA